jgi:hypothetical protein
VSTARPAGGRIAVSAHRASQLIRIAAAATAADRADVAGACRRAWVAHATGTRVATADLALIDDFNVTGTDLGIEPPRPAAIHHDIAAED